MQPRSLTWTMYIIISEEKMAPFRDWKDAPIKNSIAEASNDLQVSHCWTLVFWNITNLISAKTFGTSAKPGGLGLHRPPLLGRTRTSHSIGTRWSLKIWSWNIIEKNQLVFISTFKGSRNKRKRKKEVWGLCWIIWGAQVQQRGEPKIMIGKNDLRCQTQIKMSQGESRRQGVHSISRPSGMGISREVLAGTETLLW